MTSYPVLLQGRPYRTVQDVPAKFGDYRPNHFGSIRTAHFVMDDRATAEAGHATIKAERLSTFCLTRNPSIGKTPRHTNLTQPSEAAFFAVF